MDDSSSASSLVTPPPSMLTDTDIDERIAVLDLGGRHANRDVTDYFGGGLFRERMVTLRGGSRYSVGKYGDYINRAGDDDYNDLDDELVPVSVSKMLKRGRLRKLGKRERAKIRYFKRCPYSHVKSGCIYGKHGFGFRFGCCFSGNSLN